MWVFPVIPGTPYWIPCDVGKGTRPFRGRNGLYGTTRWRDGPPGGARTGATRHEDGPWHVPGVVGPSEPSPLPLRPSVTGHPEAVSTTLFFTGYWFLFLPCPNGVTRGFRSYVDTGVSWRETSVPFRWYPTDSDEGGPVTPETDKGLPPKESRKSEGRKVLKTEALRERLGVSILCLRDTGGR